MQLLEQVKHFPETVQFHDVIAYIDSHFDFTPAAFKNGNIRNEEGQNSGSCKIFGFASYYGLPEDQTLHLFGEFYREDVLKHPNGNDHQNIRNFMEFGWDGVIFESDPLKEK
ncbi:type III effector [Chryseobacterium sp. P1-3]|uniref:Type III effector n=1 Tax=Chryseobacterium gallinarum TaxID=1324352 RepID=A0A0G3M694_CHRGL|nr:MULTISPECIES: HopJ type III effector protein [Chryseobacterium]AKK73528.1 type III effector [Chryseobacterium gallinarum]KFF74271.1 type III effector [Chryseobacterium sp. P1-3]MCL8537283.1 HopJ type III effector protein [Chryseobacterium gallinarum]QIY90635.1 HopJ type III effector protein [Chryseobacterium gallinarum]